MRRATISLPDHLDQAVERFRREQPASPSLTTVVQVALEQYLLEADRPTRRRDDLAHLLRHRREIRRIVAAHGGSRPRLFGSVARGEQGVESDVDLLVDLAPGSSLFDLAAIRAELELLLAVPVDVVPSAGMDDDVRKSILDEALPL